jgi:hypothetical protein
LSGLDASRGDLSDHRIEVTDEETDRSTSLTARSM